MGTAECDIKNLFTIFLEVFKFCEGLSDNADPKILFKSANVTEKAYLKFQTLNAVKDFEGKINDFWRLKGFQSFPLQYFEKASHSVISRYLADSKFEDDEVRLAMKEFIFYNSEQELVTIVQNLNHTNYNVELLNKTVFASPKLVDYKTLLLLEQLKKILICADKNVDVVSSAISRSISVDEECFQAFINILCLPNDCELTVCIQELVLLNVCNNLQNNKNGKLFFHILNLKDETFGHITGYWKSLTDCLIKIIEISIKNLQCNDSTSSCVWQYIGKGEGLMFEDVVSLINKLKAYPLLYTRLKECLLLWKEEGFSLIVEDILRICEIK